jgi:hypothetical protein
MQRTGNILGALAALVISSCFAGLCMAQQPTDVVEPSQGGYVILTNIPDTDAFAKAATEFKALLHPEAKIVQFDVDKWDALAKSLRDIKPRYVAVVVKPETLDINFQGKFLKLCTEMDDDPFCDFSYGYITGGTAEETLAFVQNIAKAKKRALPHKILETPTMGGSDPKGPEYPPVRQECTGLDEGYGVDWPLVKLAFGEIDRKQMNAGQVTAWVNKNISDFQNNGVIMMGGHGMPKGIVGNMSGKDIRKLKLFPAVVFNYACMTGCVSRSYEWIEEADVKAGKTGVIQAKTVPADESIALAVIASGASAYVASIEPRLAGPGMTGELTHALCEGATLGDTRRREYDMLILTYLGWGEKGIVITPFVDGDPRYDNPKAGKNARRDRLMMNGVSTVLFGDPATKIYDQAHDGDDRHKGEGRADGRVRRRSEGNRRHLLLSV